MKKCVECGNEFEFRTHNQKYCSNQCCRVATNKRIMEKYYEKRKRLTGQLITCECGAPLSKYGDGALCVMCDIKHIKARTDKVIGSIENVISGFEKSKSKKSTRN